MSAACQVGEGVNGRDQGLRGDMSAEAASYRSAVAWSHTSLLVTETEPP